MWDQRDIELDLRSKQAKIISSIISGVDDATPTPDDYALADALRDLIEKEIQAW